MESVQQQEIYYLVIAAIAIMLFLAVAFVLFYFFSQRRMLLQEMEGQQRLIEHTIMAQEEERSRIAKDMHDEVGSKLNVISLHTQQLKFLLNDEQQLNDSIRFITANISDAIQTTRRISHDLLPPVLEELGLVEALEELCDAYERAGALEVEMDADKTSFLIKDKKIELNVFRILQELISNSIRHGEAKQLRIRCTNEQGRLEIYYKDNGKGFDTGKHSKGLGMRSIDSRIGIIDADWNYHSSPGDGMEVNIRLNPE